MEKILIIEKTTLNGKDGFRIITNKQEIFLGIDNGQSCCENWGYFMSEDDLNNFVGHSLIDIKITDTQLKSNSEFDVNNIYEGDVMFVDIITSNGVLQFVAYNEHNGYYGHEACVISTQLTEHYYL